VTRDLHRITVVGSFEEATLPSELSTFYSDGTFINRQYKKPMEMDAYSLYLGLKALERRESRDFSVERKALVNAVIGRMTTCNGFWAHGLWTNSDAEIHMRFTAASLRLLGEAWTDGLLTDPSVIVSALKKHLSYRAEIECGTWFLHDSLEMVNACRQHPLKPFPNSVWGSSHLNCLVLNTHVDTLSTAIYLLQRLELSALDRRYFHDLVQSGLKALSFVLSQRMTRNARLFAGADAKSRSVLFSLFALPDWQITTICRKVFYKLYFSARQRVQIHFPLFVFPDGYIGRDIGIRINHLEYHYVNASDLANLMIQLKESTQFYDQELFERCGVVVDNAIDYAVRSTYRWYLLSSMSNCARAILVCEAILARLSTMAYGTAPVHWIQAYCRIRRSLPPTPALIGYDPFVVSTGLLQRPLTDGWDYGVLRNGRCFAVNYQEDRLFLDCDERACLCP
jgi:hypothetical protein